MTATSTWFVVLSQSRMKIFTRENAADDLHHFQTFQNEDVALRGKDLLRHQNGEFGKGAEGGSGIRNSLHADNPAHDLEVGDFTHHMAVYLDDQRKKNQFLNLKISAEPRTLGLIKGFLTEETKKHVLQWVHKDLEKADITRLNQEFSGLDS